MPWPSYHRTNKSREPFCRNSSLCVHNNNWLFQKESSSTIPINDLCQKGCVLWEDFKLEDKHDDDATTVMLLLWYGKGSHNYYTAKQRPKGWGWDYCCCLFHREKGELELVVVVLISDLSQHCVLRGPKRRGLRPRGCDCCCCFGGSTWQRIPRHYIESCTTKTFVSPFFH